MQGGGGDHQHVQSIAEWLEDQGLDQYENNFRVNGFDNLDFLVSFSGVGGVGWRWPACSKYRGVVRGSRFGLV